MRGSLKDRLLTKCKRKANGCLVWTGVKLPVAKYKRGGYGTIGLGAAKLGKGYVHRVSYTLFVGEIPDGMCVLHKCDNRLCVEPTHLFLGTKLENARDCDAKGRRPKGMSHFYALVTDSQVRKIRKLYEQGVTQRRLATQYGVCQANISNIVKRKSWSHID